MPKNRRSRRKVSAERRRNPRRSRGAFGLALILATLSGCAALAHQILWTRRLIDLLGGSAESSTRVFGVFFLGLALGAAIATRLIHRVQRPLRMTAIVEIGVAIFSILALLLPAWTQWIWPAIGPEGLTGWPGSLVKLVLSLVVVLPPSLMMGVFLPFLVRAVLQTGKGIHRHGIWLYSVNTLGGVLGIFMTVWFALHAFGAWGAIVFAMALNCLVAAGCLILERVQGDGFNETQDPVGSTEPPAIPRSAFLLAFLSGAGILAIEVVVLEMFLLVASISFYAVSAVLAAVILMLALAAMLSERLVHWMGNPGKIIPAVFSLGAIALVCIPLMFLFVFQRFYFAGAEPSVFVFTLKLVGIVTLVTGAALLIAGLVFPLVVAWTGTSGADPHGRRLGFLLAVNGVGGLIGAELTYRVVLPAFNVHLAMGAIATAYALLGAAFAWFDRNTATTVTRVLSAVSVAIVAFVVIQKLPNTPILNLPSGFQIVEMNVGREGIVSVVKSPHTGRVILIRNQYRLGTETSRYNQERQGHVPLLLHSSPQRVAFIGAATGITPGAALQHEEVESITAIELSPLVAQAAKSHFGDLNGGVMEHPKTKVVIEDGRTLLAASPDRFDVIVADMFLPWNPGVGRLYTLEHFQAVRDALRKQGLFCQWLPMHQMSQEHFEIVASTFQRVFPDVYMFRNTTSVSSNALALVGFRDSELDWQIVARRCQEQRELDLLVDPLVRHQEGIAMLYLGRLQQSELPPNTLNNMRFELLAGRDQITASSDGFYFGGDRWIDFVADSTKRANLPKGMSGLPEVALVMMLADNVEPDHPVALRSRAFLEVHFPPSIANDGEADWNCWPDGAKWRAD